MRVIDEHIFTVEDSNSTTFVTMVILEVMIAGRLAKSHHWCGTRWSIITFRWLLVHHFAAICIWLVLVTVCCVSCSAWPLHIVCLIGVVNSATAVLVVATLAATFLVSIIVWWRLLWLTTEISGHSAGYSASIMVLESFLKLELNLLVLGDELFLPGEDLATFKPLLLEQ